MDIMRANGMRDGGWKEEMEIMQEWKKEQTNVRDIPTNQVTKLQAR